MSWKRSNMFAIFPDTEQNIFLQILNCKIEAKFCCWALQNSQAEIPTSYSTILIFVTALFVFLGANPEASSLNI